MRRRTKRLTLLELALWTVCAIALGSAFWIAADAWLYQWRAERELVRQESPLPGSRDTDRIPDAAPGEPLALLSIPRIGLSVVVAEGTSDEVLRRAAGRFEPGARVGESGNVVIAGHRDTFFRPLERVQVGDRVTLTTVDGRQTYRVEWTKVVDPRDLSVLEPQREAELTLVTCWPFRWVGTAPLRFVVRAAAEDQSPMGS